MRTLKLILAYDGTHYVGWQAQGEQRTVQRTLEQAWKEIAQEEVRVLASGRTDSGVHALGQVARIGTRTRLEADVVQRALNASLPNDLVVLSVEEAPSSFHPIRDAKSKRYRYVIHDGPLADVFCRHFSWKVWQRLDAEKMHRAAQPLLGEHDFRSFQTSGSDRKTTVRKVTDLFVRRGERTQSDLITIEIEANGFLYNMARVIVGTLAEVGRGARDESWPLAVLDACDRRAGGTTAPPQGLFLVSVRYKDAPRDVGRPTATAGGSQTE
jgi:tRNA pseudouridine38-40 synthase